MTIKEIAKMAGVSNASVSRYLNNGYISDEKKEAIRKAIEETGYQPSAHAQMLRTKKTRLIGVLIPKINSDSTSRTVAGISKVLSENGFQILLADTENSTDKELEYLQLFQNHQVDGIIFLATILSATHKKLMKETSIPIVVIGQKVNGISCVYHNDFGAAKDVTKLLLRKKRTALACIHVNLKDKAAGQERLNGFLSAVKESGICTSNVFLSECTFLLEDAKMKTVQLMEAHPEIDSIFCATDALAIGAILALKQLGKRIPEDIGIAGIGNTELARIISPTLTSVHYYYMSRGMEAARIMLEMLDENSRLTKQIQLGYHIEERESI